MKREDNKHTIAQIYGLCVFFKLSSGNKYINKPNGKTQYWLTYNLL